LADERWGVEVSVSGFGPDHPVWPKFAERAMRERGSAVQWLLPQASNRAGISRIRAITTAPPADVAIRRVMRAIREWKLHPTLTTRLSGQIWRVLRIASR
jgi:hypothetical protein